MSAMHYPLVAVYPREKGDEPGVFGRQKSVASEVVDVSLGVTYLMRQIYQDLFQAYTGPSIEGSLTDCNEIRQGC